MSKSMIAYDAPVSGMTPYLTFLFALAGGIAVGNLYWAQPLLSVISDDLGASQRSAGLLVTMSQIGYAAGVLLIVPLGDTLNRRNLIPGALFASSVALLAAAFAPSYALLLVALLALGLATTAGQMIVPLVGDLAAPEQRGRAVGTVVSGLLSGILLSRALSGLIAEVVGWRGVFMIAAIAASLMAVCLRRGIPDEPRRPTVPYLALLASTYDTVRAYAAVRATLLMGACAFAVFSMFWTGLTFLLSEPPYSYSLAQIGLVGIAGLAGAIAAKNAGRLHDRGLSVPGQGLALGVTLLSLIIAAIGADSILVILFAVLVLDGAIQSVNVLNQLRILSVDPARRSRINSAFVACNFAGGAFGSALAGIIWPMAGWAGIMIAASFVILIAGYIWSLWRHRFQSADL